MPWMLPDNVRGLYSDSRRTGDPMAEAGNAKIAAKLGSIMIFLFAATLVASEASAQSNRAADFVQRSGTHLTLGGSTFRYSGPNIEWLGLEGYGPHDAMGPRYPTRFEIDDAFATSAEMGARVVRAQTMGDTVGCALCVEPEEGQFNEAAFQASDYALLVARRHNMKIIVTLVGDCATCAGGGLGQYLAWEKKRNPQDFFTDSALIAAFEKHIDAVLNHLNPLTGVRYKDDPTILAWENCNMCGLVALLMGGGPAALAQVSNWVETIGRHVKQQDSHHLYLDTSGIFRAYPNTLDNESPDLVTFEYYPHWDLLLGGGEHTTAATFTRDAAAITARRKAYIVNEFGWDRTDWNSPDDLQIVLDTLAKDPNVSGDDFWALAAHLDNFGFQPIPADTSNPAYAEHGESGEWWALYYPGVKTLVNSASDMAARTQQLRAHAYAMAAIPLPKHMTPPKPEITAVVLGGLIAWRGSAGALRYSIERLDNDAKEWKTICDRCATDAEDPWPDPQMSLFGARYRVIAYNADGTPSAPSDPR
jgi:mannan endo-1,4-beta-mannosidase